MKRLNQNLWHLSLALPCMLLAVGCDNNTTPEVESNEPVELQINPTVALTRGVIQGGSDHGFADNTSISVYATGTSYTDGNNYAVYTLSSSNWGNTDTSNKILLSNEKATIYAYYPSTSSKPTDSKIDIDILEGNEGGADGTTATIIKAVDNSSGAIAAAEGEKDYMYATKVENVNNKTEGGVTLAMQHALAMITFCPKLDASYKGNGKLSKIQLKDANDSGTTLGKSNTGSKLNMNVTDGSISGTPVDANYVRMIKAANGSDDFTVTTSTSNKFSMLVLPTAASIGSNIQATFTIDGADYAVNLTAPTNGSDTNKTGHLLAGNNYTYNVTLKGTELSISSVTVTAWTDGTFGTGDDNLEIN